VSKVLKTAKDQPGKKSKADFYETNLLDLVKSV
jgi:hypothetical protein